jgi:beta-glucosidase
LSPNRVPPTQGTSDAPLSDHFLFGVATAGFQVEGGYNGPGEPSNNWLAWEQVGRVEPSGPAVGFWERPDESLDRVAALGCNSFRLSIEWARVFAEDRGPDRAVLARYAEIVDGCVARGLEPLVTLHHFTHPAWLGEDFWLRPDAPRRFREWAEVVVGALGQSVRLWVTINEINVLAIGSWLSGMFPPGRSLAFADAAIAIDNLLTAHVLAYEAIHQGRADAVVTTNNGCSSAYDFDRLLTDVLLARSAGVDRVDVDPWFDGRRGQHDSLLPANGVPERLARKALREVSPYGTGRRPGRSPLPRRAIDAVYASPYELTLDVVGVDYYSPMVARHFRLPGRRTAGGRNLRPTRMLWDDSPDPAGLARWLGIQHRLAPGVPLWVVENGLCNRVRNGRSYPRADGWDRPRYLRENIAAVMAAVDAGIPVAGYWHWSLVDNYEWGSYEPRFGLYGVDRHRGDHGVRWLDADSLGDDAAGTYRAIMAGLRAGDRSVLEAG